ncbi:MAG TPA: hypothetical protein VK324_12445, partial [Tepidisphaeraceae bacterium]|nr:hypothetical protein [Tepidisphaeraceae bacterium]
LFLTRATYERDVPLVTYAERDADDGSDVKAGDVNGGLLGDAAADIRRSGAADLQIVRSDTTNVGPHMVGMLVSRFAAGTGDRRQPVLSQKAIIRASPTLYYTLTYMTRAPHPSQGDDGRMRQATDLFAAVLDSVRLLDQTEIRDDQERRLYATRLLLVNLSSLTEPWVLATLVPERWVRVQQDGKDVGYSYVVEEQAPFAGRKGLRIGIRSRRIEGEGAERRQTDSESWLTVSDDRRHEKWSHVVNVTDAESKVARWRELGQSDTIQKRVAPQRPQFGQPDVQVKDVRTLEVTHVGDLVDAGEPQQIDVPPWYLPQAAGYLLPRLVPLEPGRDANGQPAPRRFMFATYVSEGRRLMHRYVDVLGQRTVELNGRKVRAVPIEDRVGLDGAVTTHYVSPDGQYLGSTSTVRTDGGRESVVTALPTTEAELKRIWADALLTRPEPAASREKPRSDRQ